MSQPPTFEDALGFAQDLVRIPSLSGQEGEVAKRVLREMETLGFDERRMDRMGNVIGVIRGTSGGPPIMLNCHMDVVAVYSGLFFKLRQQDIQQPAGLRTGGG